MQDDGNLKVGGAAHYLISPEVAGTDVTPLSLSLSHSEMIDAIECWSSAGQGNWAKWSITCPVLSMKFMAPACSILTCETQTYFARHAIMVLSLIRYFLTLIAPQSTVLTFCLATGSIVLAASDSHAQTILSTML